MILEKQWVDVSTRGELVIWAIGNTAMNMDHETAMGLSTWIWVESRRAKRIAGSGNGFRPRVVGVLTNATPEGKRPRLARGERRTELLRRNGIRVQVAGNGLVNVTISRNTMSLPFSAGLRIATWLRVRAKQAARHVGDLAKWSAIGRLEVVEDGQSPFSREH